MYSNLVHLQGGLVKISKGQNSMEKRPKKEKKYLQNKHNLIDYITVT